MSQTDAYETVIGLEVHAQLLTETKLFSGDGTAYGAEPNSQISPVTLGYPGTLPVLNQKAVAYAIKMGLACHCTIERNSSFARKNYFYPDLPKGYQISQHTKPICGGGQVAITIDGQEKHVILNRIHLEEDAGKSIHDRDPQASCLDYNRAGVALIEIVTEPCLGSGDEAVAYLTSLRRLLRYLDVCDGNMEEGSMRCDANISVRPAGESSLGTKVEIKNLNSIRNVKRAIEYEAGRLRTMLQQGETVVQETRRFDAANGTTSSMRAKEEANDYRYFPDPDLPPFRISEAMLTDLKESLPLLPEALVKKFTGRYQLSVYDADVLSDDRATAVYYEKLVENKTFYKAAANWMLGPVKSWLNEHQSTIENFPVSPGQLGSLIGLVEQGHCSFSVAAERLLPVWIGDPAEAPLALATRLNLVQTGDTEQIRSWVTEVLDRMPEKVTEYRKGKKGLIGLFVGEVKKISRGKADPKLTQQLLAETLDR